MEGRKWAVGRVALQEESLSSQVTVVWVIGGRKEGGKEGREGGRGGSSPCISL